MLSFSAHCASLGFPLKNVRWPWCAQSRDGSRVLFTIWHDELAKDRFVLFPTSEQRPGEITLAANSTLGAREIQHISKLAANDLRYDGAVKIVSANLAMLRYAANDASGG